MRTMTSRRDFLLGAAAAAACAGCAGARSAAPGEQGAVRIVHCGDPQFGFGTYGRKDLSHEEAYRIDLARFERTIESVNRLRPDLCFIAGDMTDRASDLERDWPRLLKRFEVPVVVTPGNHDLGDKVARESVTRENVERFRRVFGYDHTSVRVGKWRFISGNSQLWFKTNATDLQERYEAWIEKELGDARAKGEPVILGAHFPPFVRWFAEESDHQNCPKEKRLARFERYADCGVRCFLAGHTHTVIARAHRGMMFFNAETTCCNFDGRPFGFRLLTLREDGSYAWDFHPQA